MDQDNRSATAAPRTALNLLSTGTSPRLVLGHLPARLDDTNLAIVEQLAKAPLPALRQCGDGQLAEALRTMLAVLPRRAADDLSGSLFVAAYKREFGERSWPEIEYLRDTSIRRCRWFPTVAECHDILREWQRDDEAARCKRQADLLAGRERLARFNEARDALRAGRLSHGAIEALPLRWKAIFIEQGHLHRCADCGTHGRRRPERPVAAMLADHTEVLNRMSERFPSHR